jgi:carboxyl-terminal processing protease
MKITALHGAVTHRRYITSFVAAAFLFLLLSGCAYAQKEPEGFEVFWKTWRAIEQQYADRDNLDRQKMINGAVKGLVNSLDDPHTIFRDAEETRSDEEHLTKESSFAGIGAGLMIEEKVLIIASITKSSPAQKAGLMRNDKVLFIDKKPTAKMTLAEAVSAIRGKEGTTVVLTILRANGDGKPVDVSIVRGTITVPTCELEIKENGSVAHVKLNIFSDIAPKRMNEISEKIEKAGIKKVVLDLRGNPGGYVRSCMYISSLFLPEDALVMIEDHGKDGKNYLTSSGIDSYFQTVELVVLIDKGSASASEILAAALWHHKRAVLVGATTYGKGSKQIVLGMPKKTSLRLTVAKWLTPWKECISKKGIAPDIAVEMTREDEKADKDPQLEKALELLMKK